MKWYNKVGLVIVCVLVGLAIIGVINSAFQKEHNTNPKETDELKAIQIVQNYNGKDMVGSTTTKVIVTIIQLAYGNEDIFDNPSTEFGWDSLRNFKEQGNFYDVYFNFKSYDGSKEFHFIVDMDTNEIWSGNTLASDILNIVEAEG